MTDPYAVLGLPADSDDETIRRRYLELVRQFSPEHHPEKFAADPRRPTRAARPEHAAAPPPVRGRQATRRMDAIIEELACRSPPPPGVAEDAADRWQQALTPEAHRRRPGRLPRLAAAGRRLPPIRRTAGPTPESRRSAHAAGPVRRPAARGQPANAGRPRPAGAERRDAAPAGRGAGGAREPGATRAAVRDADEAARPLLKTLVDLYDALALAGREVRRVEAEPAAGRWRDRAMAAGPAGAAVAPAPWSLPLPGWARWLGGRFAPVRRACRPTQQAPRRAAQQADEAQRDSVSSRPSARRPGAELGRDRAIQ